MAVSVEANGQTGRVEVVERGALVTTSSDKRGLRGSVTPTISSSRKSLIQPVKYQHLKSCPSTKRTFTLPSKTSK